MAGRSDRRRRRARTRAGVALAGALAACPPASATAVEPPPEPPAAESTVTAPVGPDGTVAEVVVAAPEPRYVAPTRRDRIGRVWAPVYLNEQGPFRLVLDTGASASAITPAVAAALGLAPDPAVRVRMLGVTGEAVVGAVRVASLRVGDLEMERVTLPIVADVFGGAEGVLGNHGLRDKRIAIDFRRDRISIRRSRNEPAPPGLITVAAKLSPRGLLVVPALVGSVRVDAIIDTGGQLTLGNRALEAALEREAVRPRDTEVIGVTQDVAAGTSLATPAIAFGEVRVHRARITFGDMYIFEHWRMTREPALLIGMDVLGVLEELVIDYRRREIQVRVPGA